MKGLPKFSTGDAGGYVLLLGVGAVVVVGILWLLKKQVGDAADTVGGLLSGNNALTKGTVYEGKGTGGTLGAAANTVSGGALESIGDWLGGKIFDLTHAEYDPNAPTEPKSQKQAVGDQFYNRGLLQ